MAKELEKVDWVENWDNSKLVNSSVINTDVIQILDSKEKNNMLKQKVLQELNTKDFPNLKFLFSDEVLDIAEELLLELLEKEKQQFENDLKLKDKDINFDIFVRKSDLYAFWYYLSHLSWVNDSDKIREIKDAVLPKLVDFSNEISYSKRNFEMLKYCLSNCNLDEEQKKIIEDEIKDYEIRWIALEKDKQEQLKKISLELSELSKDFSKNVLDSEKEFEYFLESDEYLKEFPESDLANAKALAEKKWKKWYAFDSSFWSYLAIMKYCSNSDVRKHFYIEWTKFASSWEFDNREIVLKIIKLKDQKAKLLWYKNFAELSLEKKMANSPEEVMDLLGNISKKAKNKAKIEVEELKNYFDLEEINPWDISYYSRKIKQEKYDLDERKMKSYFEFENTKKALFDTIKKLYNVEMKPLETDWKYDKDVEVYEVYKDWKLISYFIWDYFYNENKKSGAWANDLRSKSEDRIPVVINVMGVVKSKESETLMTLWEVETMFHEFGHALHVMLSKSKYSELSWFGVEWDFVELPSQLMEKWVSDELTIKNISKHYKTGEVLSDDLFEAYKKLEHFWTWNHTLWQNIYAITDMMFYSWTEFKDVEDLDKKYLDKVNELSLFKQPESNKRYASFSHIFAGWYSAGYYSYMWADIIVEEIWSEFKKNWIFDKQTAKKFEEKILWAGSIKKASEMFKDFMGREVQIDAFLKAKWLNLKKT